MKLEGSVVDEDIETTEYLHCSTNRVLAKCTLCYITRNQDAASPLVLNCLLGSLGIHVLIQINNHYVGPFAREQ